MGPSTGAAARARSHPTPRLESPATAWIALAVLLVVAAGLVWHETRGNTFWFDEWEWVLDRRGGGLDTFLNSHNDHLSLVPVAIYKLLFATAGLDHYGPYRAVVIAAQLLCVALLFVYASRRVGSLPAIVPAALILFLGPGAQNIIWPFQVGWLIALAGGTCALLMLDRGDRTGEVGACGFLALALASSGIGVVFTLGVLVELVLGARRRRAWVACVPLAAYALWWLLYQDSTFVRHNIVLTPGFVADAAAAVSSALVGLARESSVRPEEAFAWGRPLAVVAALAIAWRLVHMRPIPPRVVALLAILVGFWVLTALRRAELTSPAESRYLYAGAFVTVLLLADLARGLSLRNRTWAIVGAVAAVAIVSNVGALRAAARELRAASQVTKADLGAVELSRPVVKLDFVPKGVSGWPLLVVPAGPYLAAVDDLGSPAATPRQIAADPESVREVVDRDLIGMHGVRLEPVPRAATLGARPAVESATGGRVAGTGDCVTFAPAAFNNAGTSTELQLGLPATGLLLRTAGGPATVSVRRYADAFPAEPVATMSAASAAVLRIRPDLARQPWHVRVVPQGRVTACELA